MKVSLALGEKYRVVKGDCSVVGILTHIELGKPLNTNGLTDFTQSFIELTADVDGWGDPYTARIYGPWDLLEPAIG